VVAAQALLIGLRGFNPISASAMEFISTRRSSLCNLWVFLFVVPKYFLRAGNTAPPSATSLFGMQIQRRKS
jgi:hypothetical protein